MFLQVSVTVASLQQLLDNLYTEMLPLCSDLINVGRALGGLGALVFIASKVWRHQAENTPIDVFPLLRPFAIGLAISLFPSMLGIHSAPPYYHNGACETLACVLSNFRHRTSTPAGGPASRPDALGNSRDRERVIAYLRSLG